MTWRCGNDIQGFFVGLALLGKVIEESLKVNIQ